MSLEKKYVKPTYEMISKHFGHTRHYKWSFVTDFIESHKKNSLIYDIGCGNGRNMLYEDYNFIGVDNCENFINICLNKNLVCYQADMCNLPFKDNTCDGVINIASFHHLDTIDRRMKALKEMARVCKSNGKIMITIWSKNQPKKTKRIFEKYGDNMVDYNKEGVIYKRYYYIFQLEEIKNLFTQCDLKILSHEYNCGNEIFILTQF